VGWGEAGRGVLATLGASAATAVALWAWVTAGSGWSVYLVGLGGVLAGGLVFWMAARLLGAPEAREMPWLLFPRRQGSPL
jgi:hypothetical protein